MNESDHAEACAISKALYIDSLKPDELLADWRFSVTEAAALVEQALKDSNFLTQIATALRKNCGHSLVFRSLLAPPVSQDQFSLICPLWSKGAENKGKPAKPDAATATEKVILSRIDPDLSGWLQLKQQPTKLEIERVLQIVSARIAQQKVATATRNRLAKRQEEAVIDLLTTNGWTLLPRKLVDTRGAVPTKYFMHKTRFAAAKSESKNSMDINKQKAKASHQEVDIACGLRDSYVLAMECKVSNDETNSVKRINDVLKKAAAWKNHWGNFVITAALLQGVLKSKDVELLTNANVLVFWSHNLDAFKDWLGDNS